MDNYLIYKAISPSNKVYIGMTKKSLATRQKEHEWAARNNKRKRIVYSAMQKYELAFEWSVLESGLSKKEAEEKEIFYIQEYKSLDRAFGYNQAKGGLSGDIMTEESRKKWLEKMKVHYDNPEYIKRMSDAKKESLKRDPNSSEKQSSYTKSYYSNPENRAKNKEHITSITKSRSHREFMAKVKGGKPFYCVETGEHFELLQDAADRFGVDKRNIHGVLKYPNRYKTILRKYSFKYL